MMLPFKTVKPSLGLAEQVAQALSAPLPMHERLGRGRARRAAATHMNNAIKRIEQADPAFWAQEGVDFV